MSQCYTFVIKGDHLMNDFITMECPSCGGNLTIGANAQSLKCEHCGAEHLIRRDASGITLESYARCPLCNRNDKAEKVTAILRSQTHNTQGVTYQTQTTQVKIGNAYAPVTRQVAVPVQTSQTSELAKYLTPPSQPTPNRNFSVNDGTSSIVTVSAIVFLIIGGFLLLCPLCLIVGVVSDLAQAQSNTLGSQVFGVLLFGVVALVPIGLSFFLFLKAVPRERQKNQEKKAVAAARRQELRLKADEEVNRWKRAMERWNRLYYCGRDDCIFLPGNDTYAPITQMKEYLYQA
jgi:predicted RNA-binding Zn-ribbon protein involved in translation (DUF1610 family)